MTHLTVFVAGSQRESGFLTLPVDVYAADGSLLVSGTASPRSPGQFDIPEWVRFVSDRVYVIGKLPNGSMLQESVQLAEASATVVLKLGDRSPHEWLEWVTPFHNLDHLRSSNDQSANDQSVDGTRRIGKVWMTLWSLCEGRWQSQVLPTVGRQSDRGMQQLVLDVPKLQHLLQVGGEEVAWRLISLPPGGKVRIALTRREAKEGDTLDITVGRAFPDNELVMSYLTRGEIADVNRLTEMWDASDILLYAKKRDPVSAAAGAYVLLKGRRLQARYHWVVNLVNWFPYMADGAIVVAALALQQDDVPELEIRRLIDLALERGLPIFSIGASILVETMAAVHRGKDETKRFHEAYLAAQAYARAVCTTGAYFAFYGQSPAQPSWTPIYGLEGKPTDRPYSLEDADEAVFFARPTGSVRAAKFGKTRVALPPVRVNPHVVRALHARHTADESGDAVTTRNEAERKPPLFNRSRQKRSGALETSFLQEFVERATRVVERIPNSVASPPVARRSAGVGPIKAGAPRQTPTYWDNERQSHATTIFDGDE